MIKGKLIGESDGHTVDHEFRTVEDAKRWARGAGLADFHDQAARAEVWKDGELVWTKSDLQDPAEKERQRLRVASWIMARRGISPKKGRL